MRLDFTIGSSSPTPIIEINPPNQPIDTKTQEPIFQAADPILVEPNHEATNENAEQEAEQVKSEEINEEQRIQQEIQKRIAEQEFQSYQRQQEAKLRNEPLVPPTIHEEPAKNAVTPIKYRNLQQNHSENEQGDIEFDQLYELSNFTSMYINLFNLSHTTENVIRRNLAFLNYSSVAQPPRPSNADYDYNRKITKLFELETQRWNDIRSSFRLELPSLLIEEINMIKKAV